MFSKIFASIAIVGFLAVPTLVLAVTPPGPVIEGEVITLGSVEGLILDIVDSITFVVSILVVGVFVYAGIGPLGFEGTY